MSQNNKWLIPRKNKAKHHKYKHYTAIQTFHLDPEEDAATLKAKQELEEFSSSFVWQSS